jgi:kynurenine formamidase
MILSIRIHERIYEIDAANPLDISIPLEFNGEQPNAFDVEKAVSKPCEAGTLIGDTRRGGSCNFEQMTFIPHCNGTHTESVGHITRERISVHQCLKDAFVPAILISIEPENALKTSESYVVELDENDKLITRKSLEKALDNSKFNFQNSESFGLIVRTLPNDESKKSRQYMENLPPFFSTEAMNFIAENNFDHLLVDLPSIDRTFDEGKLANHRVFWNVEQGSFDLSAESFMNKTITEMIYAPGEVADGIYLLNLQIASFVADASPSRPVLFRLK